MVSVADDRVGELATVVAALRRAGLRVATVLDAAGVVLGTVDAAALASLSSVPGVAGVERQREIRLPPPDSPAR